LEFFAAAGEHEGVASFEAYYAQSLLGFFEQELVDLVLRQGVVAGAFAHADALAGGWREFNDGGGD
jgi:hypothetical protein